MQRQRECCALFPCLHRKVGPAAANVAAADAKTAQLIYTGIILFFSLAGAVFMIFDPQRAIDTEPPTAPEGKGDQG